MSARNPIQKDIDLARVEMWCARFDTESAEVALLALASKDLVTYRAARQDQKEWRGAMMVVHKLLKPGS